MGYNMGSLLLHFRRLGKSLEPRKNFIEKKKLNSNLQKHPLLPIDPTSVFDLGTKEIHLYLFELITD